MKEIYKAPNLTEAFIVQGILQSAGIESIIRGENLDPLRGMIPIVIETSPAVWILHEEDQASAQQLLEDYLQKLAQDTPDGLHWTCSACNEEVEPQFTECWKCGQSRNTPYR